MLSVVTVSGGAAPKRVSSSIAQMAKFDGFHRWRPLQRITYFDIIETELHSAYGQNAGVRIRMPTLCRKCTNWPDSEICRKTTVPAQAPAACSRRWQEPFERSFPTTHT